MSIYGGNLRNSNVIRGVTTESNDEELSNYLENYFLESVLNESGYPRIDYVQEITGNAAKNESFESMLKDMDLLLTMFSERVDLISSFLYEMMNGLSKSTESSLNKDLSKFKGKGKELNDKIDKLSKNLEDKTGKKPNELWAALKRQCKMLNNKYTETSMVNKKKFEKKLKSYMDSMIKVLEKFKADGEYDKKQTVVYEKIRDISISMAKEYDEFEFSWYDYMFKDAKYTVNDIKYIIELLNIEGLEKSLLFKILNKGYVKDSKKK